MVLRNHPNFIGGKRYVASKDTFLKRKATALSALIWTGAFLVKTFRTGIFILGRNDPCTRTCFYVFICAYKEKCGLQVKPLGLSEREFTHNRKHERSVLPNPGDRSTPTPILPVQTILLKC